MDAGFDRATVAAAYEAVADDYAATFGDDLRRLPLDRALLDLVAATAGGRGPVLDLGCGPGHLGAHLATRGARVLGVDVAAGMLAVARRLCPGTPVVAADLRRLPLPAARCGGAVAFYVLQHLPRHELHGALAEVARVLRPGAAFVVAVHEGRGAVEPAPGIMGTLYAVDELAAGLRSAGFTVSEHRRREPLPHERQGERAYVVAYR